MADSSLTLRIRLTPKLIGTVVIVLGIAMTFLTVLANVRLKHALETEFASKGEAIAESLAANMEQTVGAGISTIQGAIDSSKTISGVCYVYILDDMGKVAVHTFSPSFPDKITSVNTATSGDFDSAHRVKVNERVSFEGASCRGSTSKSLEAIDIAAPISGGALGYVHVGMNREVIDQQAGVLRQQMAASSLAMLVLAVLAAAVVIAFVVTRPIGELTRVTGDIVARGDLTQRIAVRSSDEIGDLATAFRAMVEKLRSIPVTLKESVEDLGHSVAGIKEVAEAQGKVVQRQASGLAEASATTQEIRQTSALAASKAETVLTVAARAEEFSLAGQESVERSIGGLQEIRSQIDVIVERIADLSERTLQVGEIIETVKDIADQSNVLALNAAIEAAKAGEFGRGFAVVAREIRSLADQSIQSTGRVREILSEIQAAIRSTVAITEEGKRRMEQSMEQIRGSGESLREMTAIIQDSSQAARQIAASVNQQNAGISQISVAISSLNGAMEETMGTIHRAEGAIEGLKTISARIASIISGFRV